MQDSMNDDRVTEPPRATSIAAISGFGKVMSIRSRSSFFRAMTPRLYRETDVSKLPA